MYNPYLELYPKEQFEREYKNTEELVFGNTHLISDWVPISDDYLVCFISKDKQSYKLFYSDNHGFMITPVDKHYHAIDYCNIINYYVDNNKIRLEKLIINEEGYSFKTHNISIDGNHSTSINIDSKLVESDIDYNVVRDIINKDGLNIYKYYSVMTNYLLKQDKTNINSVQLARSYSETQCYVNNKLFDVVKDPSLLIDIADDLLSNKCSKTLK